MKVLKRLTLALILILAIFSAANLAAATPTISKVVTDPKTPALHQDIKLLATVTESAGGTIAATNFTVTAPNGTKVLDNSEVTTTSAANTYTSPTFSVDNIGTWSYSVTARNSSGVTATATGTFKVPAINIRNVDVWVDNNKDTLNDDGEKIGDKAKPESTLKFEVDLENTFTDDEDVDIDNVVITIEVTDIDDGDDLEEESDEFDLKSDKRETVTIDFGKLPLAVDEGNYDVIITVEGEDDDGVEHTVVWNSELTVDKESHDVKLRRAAITPSIVSCSRDVRLSVQATNFGSDEEDEVFVVASNPELGIEINEGPIELENDLGDDDSSYEKTYSLRLPDTAAPNIYEVEVRVFRDVDNLEDVVRPKVTMEACTTPTTAPEPVTPTTPTVPTAPEPVAPTPTGTAPTTPTGTVVAVPEKSFTDSPWYIAALVAANLVVIGLGVTLITRLVPRA